jgi:hypothetical protein
VAAKQERASGGQQQDAGVVQGLLAGSARAAGITSGTLLRGNSLAAAPTHAPAHTRPRPTRAFWADALYLAAPRNTRPHRPTF